MAIGDKTDFVIYHEQFFGGFSEALEQQSDLFNAAGAGSIILQPRRLKGDYEQESFFQNISNLISRRDVTSTAAATDLAMTQDEFIGVKVNRKIGPVTQTRDSFRKLGSDPEIMSFVLGQQIGKAVSVEMADTAIGCLKAALTGFNSGNMVHDGTAGTVTHSSLVSTMAKMGDAAQNIAAWVMHSKTYFDLVGQAIADKVYEVAGVTIYTGAVATLGRPAIVIDSAPLVTSGTPDTYGVLGLVQGAAVVDESEGQDIVTDTITGQENILQRLQGEYAYNVKIRGCKWDVANGGANPNDTALRTSTNWDDVTAAANAGKGGPGVLGNFQ